MALLLSCAIVCPAVGAAAQSASSPTYDSASFAQELGRLKTGLDSAGKSTDALRAYRLSLPKSWTVEAGGRHFDVPTDALVSRLAKAESQPEYRKQQLNQAREYLDALAAETTSLSGQPQARTDSAKSKLDAILSRSEYAHIREQSWYEKLRAQINELLFSLLTRFFRGVGGQTSLGYVLLWIGVAVGAILIAFWVFRNWFRAARIAELAVNGAAMPSKSWQQWVFASRDAASRGDYRMAIHCAYWAGIARLQDLGALAPDRAKTPREYLQVLTKSRIVVPESLATRRQALSLLTSRLEKTWYGYHLATEADFRDSIAQLEILGCHLP
jgi:hypothetical protein